MKQFYAGKLNVDEELTDFFMVKSAAVRTGSNGKDYLDLGLGDSSGEINGKKWDISPDELRGPGWNRGSPCPGRCRSRSSSRSG